MCLCLCVCYNVRCAEEVTDGSQYFVLLMITDGVISDMAQTKEAVVNVSIHNTAHKTKLCVWKPQELKSHELKL